MSVRTVQVPRRSLGIGSQSGVFARLMPRRGGLGRNHEHWSAPSAIEHHARLQADAVVDADRARLGYPRVSAPSEEPATVRFAFDHDRPRKESFG
jgi:hypothetical protein